MGDKVSAPVIRFVKDGPLRVEGLERFLNSRGDAIAPKKVMALCRCGDEPVELRNLAGSDDVG